MNGASPDPADEQALEQADRGADHERQPDGADEAGAGAERGEHAAEGEHGADRQVDPAREDDERHPARHERQEGALDGDVAQVLARGERLERHGADQADDQEHDQRAVALGQPREARAARDVVRDRRCGLDGGAHRAAPARRWTATATMMRSAWMIWERESGTSLRMRVESMSWTSSAPATVPTIRTRPP
jgi:hypothetical protein